MSERGQDVGARLWSPGEIVATARRSIVSIAAGACGGCGWAALGNGVIATTQRAVGYTSEVALGTDDARTVEGRVISADVGRDLAFVLPRSNLGLVPLRLAEPGSIRVGDELLIVGVAPGQPLLTLPALVSAVGVRVGRSAVLQLASAGSPPATGAVVLDRRGRAAGLVAFDARSDPRVLAMPADAIARDLGAVDRAPIQLVDKHPTYRCPTCEEPFTPDADRCLRCGVVLPHASDSTPSPAADGIVKAVLATLGVVANKVRVGPSAWRVEHEGSSVEIQVDETGEHIALGVDVVRVPPAHHEAFYRLLLTLNDQTTGACRLSIATGVVRWLFVEPLAAFAERDVAGLVEELVAAAAHYRATLARAFDAEVLGKTETRG